jgi:hypothetical protein
MRQRLSGHLPVVSLVISMLALIMSSTALQALTGTV